MALHLRQRYTPFLGALFLLITIVSQKALCSESASNAAKDQTAMTGMDLDHCIGQDCSGNGRCIADRYPPFWHCHCVPGYGGDWCQMRKCEALYCDEGELCEVVDEAPYFQCRCQVQIKIVQDVCRQVLSTPVWMVILILSVHTMVIAAIFSLCALCCCRCYYGYTVFGGGSVATPAESESVEMRDHVTFSNRVRDDPRILPEADLRFQQRISRLSFAFPPPPTLEELQEVREERPAPTASLPTLPAEYEESHM